MAPWHDEEARFSRIWFGDPSAPMSEYIPASPSWIAIRSVVIQSVAIRSVAIQGEAGSFSHQAATQLVPGAAIVACARSIEVFARLARGEVEAAVIPIENSLAGSVLEHYDLLLSHDAHVEQEALLRIRHNLIAAPGATLAGLREVYSHPIALDQCRGFFRTHPHLRATSFYDTAGSVKHVLTEASLQAGAVASREAASFYGGSVLAEGIEDSPENYTRFFLLRPGSASACSAGPEANKVSLCFAVENRPGSLVRALDVLAGFQTNLTRIESRPVPGSPWQYIFYADYLLEDPTRAGAALAELVGHCTMVRELGRYAAAVLP